jgi:hypothetical protein
MKQTKKLTRKVRNKLAKELAAQPKPVRKSVKVDPAFSLTRIIEERAKAKAIRLQLREVKASLEKENKYKRPKVQAHQHRHGFGCRKNCRFRAGDPAASVEIEVVEHVHSADCHHEVDPVIQMAQEAEMEVSNQT